MSARSDHAAPLTLLTLLLGLGPCHADWGTLVDAATKEALAITYATHSSDGFCLTAFSELYQGTELVVLGFGGFATKAPDRLSRTDQLERWLHVIGHKMKAHQAFVSRFAEEAG
eukprot:6518511-Pyramimonas_sp.AAC.1